MKRIKDKRKFRMARSWSNKELRKYAGEFRGSVCNVSGWLDNDKEGHKYREYFKNADDYYITNYSGHRGSEDTNDDKILDLEQELPQEYRRKFNVVFNHTVLEHIFEVNKAFENLCKMAEDACIIVVPFVQEVHVSESYNDYWRFTPYTMQRLFEKNGFSLVVCEYNNSFDTAVYLFCIGIRTENLSKFPQFNSLELNNDNPAGRWIGNDRRFLHRILDSSR